MIWTFSPKHQGKLAWYCMKLDRRSLTHCSLAVPSLKRAILKRKLNTKLALNAKVHNHAGIPQHQSWPHEAQVKKKQSLRLTSCQRGG
ncbi:hypothetical protein V2G26_008804 [Clonostachys chloroleuca]